MVLLRLLFSFLLIFTGSLLLLAESKESTSALVERLRQQAYSLPQESAERIGLWQRILEAEPTHLEAHVQLGMHLITSDNYRLQEKGFLMLEDCFDETKVQPVIDMTFPQTIVIAASIGRYRSERKEHIKGKKFTELAYSASKYHFAGGDVCLEMQLASMLDPFPLSMAHADQSLQEMNDRADALLARSDLNIDEDWLSATFPGAAADPYVHCLLTLFTLSFYYRADTAATAARYYRMAAAGWPNLNYTAPHVQVYDDDKRKDQQLPCVERKIKLGVIAGVLSEGHSVTEDFSGVLSRLDRNLFQVTYIYLAEQQGFLVAANFTRKHPSDVSLVYRKLPSDSKRGAWIRRYGKAIAELELDMILYLDLTMASHARRLGMERLAPVQLNTHGHPITSGHPDSIIQYFVSWAEAELPLAQARTHYTERLKLIPHGKIHQYYERRILENQVSRMDGQPFGQLKRSDFGLPDESVRLYLCMQKPFKLHPEFDALVCGVLQKDLQGHAVLHREDSDLNHAMFQERLSAAGCDLDRVHFLRVQPHHRLLALYQYATVVLDSYPAGGCTTTREVLELGKPVVTLPARLLGGRWTLAYYNIIDLNKDAKRALIAGSEEEFINLAVALGTDPVKRQKIEESIVEAIPRLYHRFEAVEEWQKILLEVSPVHVCHTSQEDEL